MKISNFFLSLIFSFFITSISFAEGRRSLEVGISKIPAPLIEYGEEESQHRILKLEAKLNSLYLKIDDLEEKMRRLDESLSKISEILSKITELPYASSHLDENLGEYNYGFQKLRSGDYERAKQSFELFLLKYPGDIKIGEVYFWLGEIDFMAKNYKAASKNYLISYRDYPHNLKKNEALYKLSTTLSNLGKKQEACDGLDILINDERTTSKNLQRQAFSTSVEFGCRNNYK